MNAKKRLLNYVLSVWEEKKAAGVPGKKKRFPLYTDMIKHMQLDRDEIKKLLLELVKDGELNGNKYYYWPAYEDEIKEPVYNDNENQNNDLAPTNKVISEKKKDVFQINFRSIFTYFLLIGFFFISIIMLYISIDYTKIFLLKFMADKKALLASVSIVLFGAFLFPLAFQIWKKNKVAGVLLFLLWSLIILLSIFCTISGNIIIEQKKEMAQNKQDQAEYKEGEKLQLLKDRKAIIQGEIDNMKRERQELTERAPGKDATEQEIKKYNRLKVIKNIYIEEKYKIIESLDKQITELLNNNVVMLQKKAVISDFFWIASLFKIKEKRLKFFVFLLLAVLFDIMPPVSFHLILTQIKGPDKPGRK